MSHTISFFSPDDQIHNTTFSKWIEKYWQSFLYNDKKRSKGPVFTIPGKLHKIQKIDKRSFKIDQDKAILLSPINWISIGNENEQERMRNDAKYEIDIINKDLIDLTLDGVKQLRNYCYRVSTDLFDLDKKKAISDGYWLFIRPYALEKGEHTLKSFGTCRSGQIQISMLYDLIIK